MSRDLALPIRDDDTVLDDLERLAREHLLFFRVQAGRVLLADFFGGDPHAYLDRSPTKAHRFTAFLERHADRLRRCTLSQYTAREAIRCCIVFDTLPVGLRQSLMYSHVLALTRLADPTLRVRLAIAALEGDWNVGQLENAVAAAKAGLPYDVDGTTPGVQPPLALPAPKPGIVVNRLERWSGGLDELAGQWATVDASRLSRLQRERTLAALQSAQGRIAALVAELAG